MAYNFSRYRWKGQLAIPFDPLGKMVSWEGVGTRTPRSKWKRRAREEAWYTEEPSQPNQKEGTGAAQEPKSSLRGPEALVASGWLQPDLRL